MSAGHLRDRRPYVTDDPEPVEYRHWEMYLASIVSRDAGQWSGTAPHVEVNYGAVQGSNQFQGYVAYQLTF